MCLISNYPVGAALRDEDRSSGSPAGANVETPPIPQRFARNVWRSSRQFQKASAKFKVIAVVTDNGGSPCGSCRQVLAEFGLDTIVLIADGQGKLIKQTTVQELLPRHLLPKAFRGKFRIGRGNV